MLTSKLNIMDKHEVKGQHIMGKHEVKGQQIMDKHVRSALKHEVKGQHIMDNHVGQPTTGGQRASH